MKLYLFLRNKLFILKGIKSITYLFFLLSSLYCSNGMAQDASDDLLHNHDSLRIQSAKIKQVNIEAAAKATISHFVLKNSDGSYGYAIFIDGNMTYHQPNVPAINGNKGFEKVEYAEACAKLAIQKIREGESPPTLSVEEVESIINL